jgi:hypothetical protein
MKRFIASGLCTAVVAFGVVAFAETTGQTPAQPPAQAAEPQKAPEQQVTIAGCVQREADFRRARDAGKGGVAGTGVGAGNEYVLVNASIKTAAPDAPAEAPAGTTGTMPGTAYELTGKNEDQAGRHVGKRVEIVGKLKAAETSAAGPTGGATAGTPPRGIEVTGKDLKLRELEVVSVRETTGSCPVK